MQPQPKKGGAKTSTKKKNNPTRGSVPAARSGSRPNLGLNEPQATNVGGPVPLPGDLQAAIAVRAYELYERRGGQGGHELDDWLEAERQVLNRENRGN